MEERNRQSELNVRAIRKCHGKKGRKVCAAMKMNCACVQEGCGLWDIILAVQTKKSEEDDFGSSRNRPMDRVGSDPRIERVGMRRRRATCMLSGASWSRIL